MSSTTVRRVMVLEPGQHFAVPSNASVAGIIESGGGVASSECQLPDPVTYKCYHYRYEGGEDDNTGATDFVESIILDGTTYMLDTHKIDSEEVGPLIASHSLVGKIVKVFCSLSTNFKNDLYLAVPDGSVAELCVYNKLSSTPDARFYVKGELTTDCADCNAIA